MSEHKIQNEGRNALALPDVFTTRANVGTGWTGDVKKLPDGSILITNPRPFNTGLPNGFTDTFGIAAETVTADMIGQTIAVPFFVEFKAPGKRPTDIQNNFMKAMRKLGARAGVAYSAADAVHIALGGKA